MLKSKIIKNTQNKRKGQSTVEYIILVAAILAALIIFLRPGGVFQSSFNSTINASIQDMNDLGGRLAASHP
jgi:uncharacterized protein (UPF0333 family)